MGRKLDEELGMCKDSSPGVGSWEWGLGLDKTNYAGKLLKVKFG